MVLTQLFKPLDGNVGSSSTVASAAHPTIHQIQLELVALDARIKVGVVAGNRVGQQQCNGMAILRAVGCHCRVFHRGVDPVLYLWSLLTRNKGELRSTRFLWSRAREVEGSNNQN